MKSMGFFVPAVFCAFLSLLAMGMPLVGAFVQMPGLDEAWKPAFYSFLPMCFYFVGAFMLQMHREINDLRQQLSQLRGEADR